MKELLERLLEKLLEKPLARLAKWAAKQKAGADAAGGAGSSGGVSAADEGGAGASASPGAGVSDPSEVASPDNPPPSSKPWVDCHKSSNWNGSNAQQRMMNMLSPKFDERKFRDYLEWILGRGCDHVHLFLMNQGDGEGAGYDCCTDAKANALALERIRTIRSKGLGVVLWVVADDSDAYRKRLFADPGGHLRGASNLLAYASAVVLGLEMDEGGATASQWEGVRKAVRANFFGAVGTHHTSGRTVFLSLGEFICDQLDPKCTAADIAKSVRRLAARGKTVVGFEYARQPDRAKAQAALDAGAHAVGNW